MSIDFPCTHPDGWPCRDSKIHPGRCGTQETYDAAMGCIDGHYALNPKGSADVGDIDMIDGDNLKTGWTGKSEEVVGELSEQELEEWDELDQAGKWDMPPERRSSFDDERDEDA